MNNLTMRAKFQLLQIYCIIIIIIIAVIYCIISLRLAKKIIQIRP